MSNLPEPGKIGWTDLTVPNADEVRDFYAAVVGWRPAPVPMGGYDDYSMLQHDSDQPVAGVCHSRGVNDGLPPVWLIYITVPDLDASLREVLARGGEIVRPTRGMGGARYTVISDPAGAVCALYQPESSQT